jgi:hypothetical protein
MVKIPKVKYEKRPISKYLCGTRMKLIVHIEQVVCEPEGSTYRICFEDIFTWFITEESLDYLINNNMIKIICEFK